MLCLGPRVGTFKILPSRGFSHDVSVSSKSTWISGWNSSNADSMFIIYGYLWLISPMFYKKMGVWQRRRSKNHQMSDLLWSMLPAKSARPPGMNRYQWRLPSCEKNVNSHLDLQKYGVWDVAQQDRLLVLRGVGKSSCVDGICPGVTRGQNTFIEEYFYLRLLKRTCDDAPPALEFPSHSVGIVVMLLWGCLNIWNRKIPSFEILFALKCL